MITRLDRAVKTLDHCVDPTANATRKHGSAFSA